MFSIVLLLLLYLKTFILILLICTIIFIVFCGYVLRRYLLINNLDLRDIANTLVTVVHCKSGAVGICRRKTKWVAIRRK
jgi:hypothetical protein